MDLNEFLNKIESDVEDIQKDIEFDLGQDSVPFQKLIKLKKLIENFSNEV